MGPIRTRLVWGFFLFSLGFALWALHVGWKNPLLDAHSFRQTQTALSVLRMKEGGPLLAYETPVLGAPWRLPLEFPLYQWMVLLVDKVPGVELDQAGRLVSIIFLFCSFATVFLLLKELGFSSMESIGVLPIFFLAPNYLFWGRTFLIETTALSLSLLYLLCALRFGKQALASGSISSRLGCGIFIFGTLAAMVKITTFLFFPVAVLLLMSLSRPVSIGFLPGKQALIICFILCVSPFVGSVLWTAYADSVRAETPFADFLASRSLTTWTFGTNAQRFDWSNWQYLLGERFFPDLLGHVGAALCLLMIVCLPKRSVLLVLSSLSIFLLFPFVFINLYLVHSYYQSANGFFLLLSFAFIVVALGRSGKESLALLLTLLLMVLQLNRYFQEFSPFAESVDTAPLEVAARVRQFTKPEDVVLIYGLDWSPEIPYYSRRRALMDRDFRSLDDESFLRSRKLSVGEKGFGAVLACGHVLGDLPEVERRVTQLGFSEKDFFQVRACRLYMRSEMKSALPTLSREEG